MSFLDHIARCNNADLGQFEPWFIGATRAGFIHRDFAARPDLFARRDGAWHLAPGLDTPDRRTAAVRAFLLALRERGQFGNLWREEPYAVTWVFTDPPLMTMERAAVPWFGVRAFGVHVNGFVRKKDGIYIWVGERALDRRVDPGKLDNMIGGGQPIGLSIRENLRKEAMEEAGIVPALIDTAKHVRTMRYRLERNSGLRNDTLFIFDLELAEDFVPQNTDNEVAAFHLLPAAEVATIIHDTDHFKFNCNMVIVDFLVRHGHIGPTHPEYQALMSFLERDKAEHMAITSRADLPSA